MLKAKKGRALMEQAVQRFVPCALVYGERLNDLLAKTNAIGYVIELWPKTKSGKRRTK